MASDSGDRGGDHRLRHGHRQGGRALRLPLQPAQEPGELQPGDRPRRPRRAALHRGAARLPGRPVDAGELRLRRHAGPRGASAAWCRSWRDAAAHFDVAPQSSGQPPRHPPAGAAHGAHLPGAAGRPAPGHAVLRRLQAPRARAGAGDRRALSGRAARSSSTASFAARSSGARGTRWSWTGWSRRSAAAPCARWSTWASRGWRRCRPATCACAFRSWWRTRTWTAVTDELVARFHRSEEAEIARIGQVAELVARDGCQTNYLLAYFGEAHDVPCGHCTWCQTERRDGVSPAAAAAPHRGARGRGRLSRALRRANPTRWPRRGGGRAFSAASPAPRSARPS